MQSRVRLFSLDRSSYSVALHCGPIHLALEQIESYAPGHQVRFGSLNYTANIRGDLIFDGFEPQSSAPHCHDGHDLALQPDSNLDAAHESAPIFNSELAAQRIMLVFGSIAAENTTSMAGSIHPSMDGAIGSELRVRVATCAIS